jgi:SAM-dependent methyltransferase
VLWDAGSAAELDAVRANALAHMATDLPVVDIGCGNGRFSRLLAPSLPQVLGIDVSAHAVRIAEEESGDVPNVRYRVLDASAAGTGKQLSDELGEANVFMRGVLHVFDAEQRQRAVENLRDIIGQRGVVYFSETNFEGDPLISWSPRGRLRRACLSRCGNASQPVSGHPGTSVMRSWRPSSRPPTGRRSIADR